MIGSFASIIFTVSSDKIISFQDLKRDTSARFATHEVIAAKPKVEFLGQQLDSMGFSIELSAFLGVNPIEQIDKLRDICQKGKENYFILGGKNMGKYVIESVSQSYGLIMSNGKILTAKADISLKEYH